MQEKLHHVESKQSKSAKIDVSIRLELESEKCNKNFCKIIEKQNMLNQTNTKHSSNPEDIFKYAKKILGKQNTKEDSSKIKKSEVLSKILNGKKTLKQQYNFCEANISVEVHGM